MGNTNEPSALDRVVFDAVDVTEEQISDARMEHLDMGDQVRSPDLTGTSVADTLGHSSQPSSYNQPYSDPSLLQFNGHEGALGVLSLPFSPTDPNAFQYPLAANALGPIQQQQSQADESKKDIKRRTKTGCLTCRKRRIKCDEAQPICNNCRKSKRECQGYDPLFRNQQSPATIQPATSRAKQVAAQKLPSASQSAYPAPPAGYAAVQSSGYPVASMAQAHNDPATYDFSAHIDPALQSQGVVGFGQHLNQGLFNNNNDDYQIEVKPTAIEDLMQIGAPAPPAQSSTLSNDNKQDMKQLFSYYAGGLNKLLETQWMQQNGWTRLQKTPLLINHYNLLLSRMAYTAEQHPYENQINLTIEAHIVWGTLELAKWASDETYTDADNASEPKKTFEGGEHIDVHETAARFEILKALITNTYLTRSKADDLSKFDANIPKSFNALSKQLLTRERNFWKHTAKFLTLDTDTTLPETIDAALADMRGLLESKENRDIMYSVAVMRIWPQRLMAREQMLKNEGASNPQLDADDLKKVEVAKAFLTQQAGGRGTTAPSQRICGMILKGWQSVNVSFIFTGA